MLVSIRYQYSPWYRYYRYLGLLSSRTLGSKLTLWLMGELLECLSLWGFYSEKFESYIWYKTISWKPIRFHTFLCIYHLCEVKNTLTTSTVCIDSHKLYHTFEQLPLSAVASLTSVSICASVCVRVTDRQQHPLHRAGSNTELSVEDREVKIHHRWMPSFFKYCYQNGWRWSLLIL